MEPPTALVYHSFRCGRLVGTGIETVAVQQKSFLFIHNWMKHECTTVNEQLAVYFTDILWLIIEPCLQHLFIIYTRHLKSFKEITYILRYINN